MTFSSVIANKYLGWVTEFVIHLKDEPEAAFRKIFPITSIINHTMDCTNITRKKIQ